ncbi:MAG: FAD-binding oxidoreductase [Patescibacteria group bacterium]
MAQKITLEVAKKEQVTEKVYFVTFRLVTPSSIDFRAGQNMMLMISPGINRTMSIASPPSQNQELLIVHDVSPMGPGSQWTVGLKVGDRATIVAPTGGALSFIQSPRKKVMVATGTGVAPFHAMVLDYFNAGTSAQQTPLVLYWGLRYEQDVYWKEEFDRVSSLHPTFIWHLILSRPTEVWQGGRGHVTEYVLETEKDMEHTEFYLCGNKTMIEEVREALLTKNVPKEQIKTELFY